MSEVYSTKEQLKEFKEGLIWKDFKKLLDSLRKATLIEYDLVGESIVNDEGVKVTPTTAEVLIHLGDIKGRRKAINHFLEFPNILISTIEMLEEEKKDDSRS